jgi:hypothetical protein
MPGGNDQRSSDRKTGASTRCAPTGTKPGRGTHPSTAGETPTATRGQCVDALQENRGACEVLDGRVARGGRGSVSVGEDTDGPNALFGRSLEKEFAATVLFVGGVVVAGGGGAIFAVAGGIDQFGIDAVVGK